MKNTSVLLLISLLFYSCQKINGNGQVSTSERTHSGFHSIVVKAAVDLEINTGKEEYKSSLQMESNLEPYLKTYVTDSVLFIEIEKGKSIRTTKKMILHTYTQDLHAITIYGSANTRIDSLQGPHFSSEINGSGDLHVSYTQLMKMTHLSNGSGSVFLDSGHIETCYTEINGSGSSRSDQVETKVTSASITGSGDVYTYTTDSLRVRIQGSGSVHYKGNPQKDIGILGSGSVEAL